MVPLAEIPTNTPALSASLAAAPLAGVASAAAERGGLAWGWERGAGNRKVVLRVGTWCLGMGPWCWEWEHGAGDGHMAPGDGNVVSGDMNVVLGMGTWC